MTGYGVDVAVQRIDDLDRRVLSYLKLNNNFSVLDIGCGAGGQSFRMMKTGVKVCGVDIYDFNTLFQKLRYENNVADSKLEFICCDIRRLSKLLKERDFNVCVAQRVIHYVRYHEAREILKYLRKIVKDKLYVSVSGQDTYLKDYYKDRNEVITKRFCCLGEEGAQKFQITNPLCLYSKSEFEKLLISANWEIEDIWVSAFGNVKAVCK